MSESNTKNVKLGPCNVFYDGIDLGLTKGGVEVSVETETHEVTVDQFGNTPVEEFINGRMVTVSAPLAETTMENLVKVMPGAEIVSEGFEKAEGTITIQTNPTDGDTVSVNSTTFTFKDTAVAENDVEIGGTASQTAASLQAKLSASTNSKVAVCTYTVADSTVTVESKEDGIAGNLYTLAATGAGIQLSGATLTGGVEGKKCCQVTTATGVSLLERAKELRLHPVANAADNTTEDFIIPLAGVAGGMSYSYMIDQERTYPSEFKAYPAKIDGKEILFHIGELV